jgi:hypothetical protein
MKKHLFILILVLCGLLLSAQTDIPHVSVDLKQLTPYNAVLNFHPKYQDFEKTADGYIVVTNGIKSFLDASGKEIIKD